MMISAQKGDREKVIRILAAAFDQNLSVNFIVKNDILIKERIQKLVSYSYDLCFSYGRVYLSDERNACALILFPNQMRWSVYKVWLDVQLILKAIGTERLFLALKRESVLNGARPKIAMAYLWFIGVEPHEQGRGIGTLLLKEVLLEAGVLNLPIYLETSTLTNLPWYKKQGFEIYHELLLSYRLYFLKHD